MPVFNNVLAGAAGGGAAAGFKIERSLRFNEGNDSFLEKTFSSAGNRKKWTWSGWVKKSKITDSQAVLFSAYGGSGNAYLSLDFRHDQPRFLNWNGSSIVDEVKASAKLRDPSAWYHIVWAVDTDQSTDANKIKLYINGVRQEEFETANYPGTGDSLYINNNIVHEIGRNVGTSSANFNGYLAEVNFVDGQQLDPDGVFGEFDADTGVWNPIEFTGNHNDGGTNYDSLLTVPGGFASGEGADKAFDGSTTTRAKASTTDDIITFDLSSLNLTGSFEFYATNAQSEYSLDGGTTWTSSLSANYTTATNDISGVSNIKFKPSSGTTMKVTAFRNQGNVLVSATPSVNGFHLDFSDNSSTTSGSNEGIGKDVSGSGNYWDSSNISPKNTIAGFNFDSTSTPFTDIGTGLAVTNVNNTSTVTATTNNFNLTTVADFNYTNNASDNYLRFATSQTVPTNYTFDYYYRLEDSATQPSNATVVNLGGELIRDYGSATSRTIRLRDTGNSHSDYSYTVTADSWNHVRVSPTGIWINGTLLIGSPRNIAGTSGALTIGTYGNSASFIINGQVGPVRITPKDLGAPLANGLVANSDGTLTTQSVANSGCDSLIDSPTDYEADSGNNGGNYCTWNPLTMSRGNMSDGNLLFYGDGTNTPRVNGTISQSSGKWYYEVTVLNNGPGTGSGDAHNSIGWGLDTVTLIESAPNTSAMQHSFYLMDSGWYKNFSGSNTNSNNGKWMAGDVIGVAADLDNNTLTFYRNGTQVLSQTIGVAAGTSLCPVHQSNTGNYGRSASNFGQRPFAYTPPTGFKSLCTQNLNDPLIADGSNQFTAVLRNGFGTGGGTVTTGFKPGLLWEKTRSTSGNHYLYDSVRGVGKILFPNLTNTETNDTNLDQVSSFTDTGYTLGGNEWNTSTTLVGWAWKDGDLATTSDTTNYNQTRTWSDNAVGGRADEPIEDLFDGQLNTFAQNPSGNTNPNNLIVNFSPGLAYTSSVEVYPYNASSVAINNGSQNSTTNQQWNTVVSGSGTLTKLDFQRNHTNGTAVSAIRVDGKILINPGIIPAGSLPDSTYNQSQKWTDFWSSTNGFEQNSQAFAFDLDDTNVSASASYGDTQSLVLTTGVAYTSSVRAMTHYTSGTAYINGDSANAVNVASGWITLASGSGTLNRIDFTSSNARAYVSKIEVDGKLLVDPTPSIPSTVRANPTAGFSIVSVPSVGDTNLIRTAASGLNAEPHFIISKNRDFNDAWFVYHKDIQTNNKQRLYLNTAASVNSSSSFIWQHTSSLIGFNGAQYVAQNNTDNLIFYCWTSVEGYSKFGSYISNNDANGPFVQLGFQPKLLIWKNADATHGWYMYDDARDPDNPMSKYLPIHSPATAEGDPGGAMDILSNGFKVRNTGLDMNTGSNRIIYMAWAEHPFKTARAR